MRLTLANTVFAGKMLRSLKHTHAAGLTVPGPCHFCKKRTAGWAFWSQERIRDLQS